MLYDQAKNKFDQPSYTYYHPLNIFFGEKQIQKENTMNIIFEEEKPKTSSKDI